MTLLRVVVGDTGPVLRGARVVLRLPTMADHAAWAEIRADSREFLRPWEPSWPSDDLTRAAFRRRIKRYHRDVREDTGAPFFVYRASDDRLIGGLTLTAIRRGVAQACSLGYWMGVHYASQGYMSDAVRTVIPHVFGEMRLHRLEAASMPTNTRSISLLENAGFTREGFARRYLLIDGKWQDHVLFA
ncbi:MAG TPA: GNAT family N-acetyltransferase, partial [Methylomirabilota bacterium]|nr:GNAT family N-acetyltransferase [Methylomirabilota bacterium]